MQQGYPHPRWKLATLQPFRYHLRPTAKTATSPPKKQPTTQAPDSYLAGAKWIELAGNIARVLRSFPDAFAAYSAVVEEFYYRCHSVATGDMPA